MKRKSRKTFKVDRLRRQINIYLSKSTFTQEQKKALCHLLDGVLMDSGNYNGYNYIQWLNGGCDEWIEAGKPTGSAKFKFQGPEYDRYYY